MIKQIPILVTVAVLWINSSFAAGKSGIPESVSQSFNTEYRQAESITWENGPGYYKANFVVNGQYLFAFYNEAGKKIAVARYLLSSQLPLNLQKDIWDRFDSYWLTDLFEYAEGQESSYYVTLENSDATLVLKSNGNSWEIFKKLAK